MAEAENQAAVCKGSPQYRKGYQGAAERTRKAAAKAAEKTKQTAAFVARHPAGVAIAVGVLLLFIMVMSGLSSCGAMFSGTLNGVLGTSYTSEDSDLVEVENSYAGLENELQSRIDNIERDNPGYDEYRYDLANIGHNPHELASYLTAKYQSYTRAEVQSELQRIFNQQYKLTLTEKVEIRYREEERTDTWTDEDGNEHTDTYTVQVPYEYYILNVKLTNTPLSTIAENNLTPEQLEMYRVYLQTSGNKPLIFGGGSSDTSASEDLSGVDFVNGTRPGNTAIVDLAKQQVGNVGGYPYWSWYALIPAWNGAPVLCPGATGKWDFPSRVLPPASRRVFRGLPLTDNGARGAMKTLPPATLSFLTGI